MKKVKPLSSSKQAVKKDTLPADRAFFELKVYLLDLRPFIAGMTDSERTELYRRCRDVSNELVALGYFCEG